ncbi:hypothetical protein G6F31_020008 [Rhizopus arrhizus]|nr:hypothetical protein G6F31_020008 [Rhizopus arrhizus]
MAMAGMLVGGLAHAQSTLRIGLQDDPDVLDPVPRGHHARPEDRAPAGAVLDRRPGQQIADVQAAHGRRVP